MADGYSDYTVTAEGDNTVVYTYTFKNDMDSAKVIADIDKNKEQMGESVARALLPRFNGRVINPVAKALFINSDGSLIATLTIRLTALR